MTTRRLKKLKIKTLINKYLGDNFEQDLIKSEVGPIYKPDANVSVFPHEIYVALQIVPRTVISLLVQFLKPLKTGQMADIPWSTDEGHIHTIHVNKISSDLYSGHISGEGKILCKFNYRSLPAVGLMIMSTYELYDKETNKQDIAHPEFDYDKVQKLIDEKIRMQIMIEDVVNKKLSEKEAIQQLINQKITDYLRTSEQIKGSILSSNDDDSEEDEKTNDSQEEDKEEESEENTTEDSNDDIDAEDIEIDRSIVLEPKKDKKHKLKEFLKRKVKKSEIININKNKDIHCHTCNSILCKSGDAHIECCICYGDSMGDKIKFTKNEQGVKLNFPKNFDVENIEMLLDNFKKTK